jgi:hypothetical protein
MLIRASIAAYCLVLILDSEAARADFSCKYDNAATACLLASGEDRGVIARRM